MKLSDNPDSSVAWHLIASGKILTDQMSSRRDVSFKYNDCN